MFTLNNENSLVNKKIRLGYCHKYDQSCIEEISYNMNQF